MSHQPVGAGVSFAGATSSARSGIITHYTDTVRVHALTGDAHVAVGADPGADNTSYYVPAGGTATLNIGRPKSQLVVGVTTGTTTIVDFPDGSGCPFAVGDKVQLTGIVPSGINGGSSGIALTVTSISDGTVRTNPRLILAHNTAAQGAVTDGEGELRDMIQVAAKGPGGTLYVQQVQITGDA